MTPADPSDQARWDRLQELFHLAEAVPEADRVQALIDAGANANLRARVLSILRAGSRARAATPQPDPPAQTIGPYRVIQVIGSGGIGTVYLVERDAGEVKQRAALKVLAPHAAGPSFADRFRREQRILNSLDHPNITRMLDAGFGARGEPYLVMEYVEGEHLDTYCDRLRLGIEDRLRLFVKVAEAVAYAHRNLVVHLDLKPSNILVTPDGSPKLLDFGTSKVLQADGGSTSTLPVTPSYASPEQLRNEAVTTSCDVYSLGVILYELLVGERPAGEASMVAMMERAIAETEPRPIAQSITSGAAEKRGVPLSRLRSILSGDLSTIVAKALAPRSAERYVSVDALTGDVERYLDGRPVLAQRQTTAYRMKKFVRRNSAKVTLSLVMFMALMATAGYAWWKQRQALHEAHRAMVMQAFMSNLFRAANSNVTGKPVSTVRELLRLGVQIVPDFIKDPDDLRQARLSLADSLYLSSDFATSQTVYEQALESARASQDKSAEAESLSQLGLIAHFSGKPEAALDDTERGYAASRASGIPAGTRLLGAQAYVLVHEDLGKTTDQNAGYLETAIKDARAAHVADNHISAALIQLGQVLNKRGSYDDAIRTFQEGIALIQNDRLSTCDEAGALYGMGGVYRSLDQNDKAAPVMREAYQRMRTCYGDSPFTLQTLGYWADAMIQAGRAKEALPELEASEPLWKTGSMNRVAASQNFVFLGRAYLADSRFKPAEQAAIHGFALIDGQVGPLDRGLGFVHLVWAMALAGQGQDANAKPHAEIADRILNSNPRSPSAKRWAGQARKLSGQLSAPSR
jgi:eukaryotic-like serine/threonine-protein kinase